MYAGEMDKILDLPAVLCRISQNNAGILAPVRRVHAMGGKKIAVHRAGNLNSGHGSTGTIPDFIDQIPVLIEQKAGIFFFGGNKKMPFTMDLKRCYPVAEGQVGNDFLFNIHGSVSFAFLLFYHGFRTGTRRISIVLACCGFMSHSVLMFCR